MFDELHWLPLHARIQFKIFSLIFKAQRGLVPQYLVGVILRPHSASSTVHFVPATDLTSWFPVVELLWLRLVPLLQLVLLFGMLLLLLFALKFSLAVFLLPSLFSKPVYFHGA